MYYSLDTDGLDNVYMEKEVGQNGHINLGMGRMWDVAENAINLPYRFTMVPSTAVREGAAPSLYGWYPGSHLMQQRLVDVLRGAGVDNLQTFASEVRRQDTNEAVPGYVVENIVGRVACARMKESTKEQLIGHAYVFQNLIIDPKQIGDLLIFRLHQSPMVVLVHERIARAIEAGNFLGLTLEAVAETTNPA